MKVTDCKICDLGHPINIRSMSLQFSRWSAYCCLNKERKLLWKFMFEVNEDVQINGVNTCVLKGVY